MARNTRDMVNLENGSHAVYSEAELQQAQDDARCGTKVAIRRYCGECGASLYGTNLEVMEAPPTCETH